MWFLDIFLGTEGDKIRLAELTSDENWLFA